MRRALDRKPLVIPDFQHRQQLVAAVKAHALQRVTDRKFIFLFKVCVALGIDRGNFSEIGVVPHIGIAVVNLRLLVRFSEEKARRVLPIGALADFLPVRFEIRRIFLRALEVVVDGAAVSARRDGRVECGLHPALDFKTVNAALDQFRDVVYHTEILRVKEEGTSLVLKDRHRLARALFLGHAVLPAAGVRALAVVCVPPRHEAREQTAAGVRDAHRAVHKSLDLHLRWDFLPDFAYLRERELSGRHDAARAEFPPEEEGPVIRVVRLSAHMQLDARAEALCQHKERRIRDDNRVRPEFGQLLKVPLCLV